LDVKDEKKEMKRAAHSDNAPVIWTSFSVSLPHRWGVHSICLLAADSEAADSIIITTGIGRRGVTGSYYSGSSTFRRPLF
jgi:hypothetical protein